METKKCSKCRIEKEFDDFHKSKFAKDGLYSQCKACKKENYENNKEKAKEYYENNRDKILEYNKNQYEDKKENILNSRKQKYDKDKKLEYNKKYYKNNKEKINTSGKKYYEDNKEKMLIASKEWYDNNKETVALNNANRLKNDSIFKLKCNIRTLIRGTFSRVNSNFRKKTKTEKILGIPISEFIEYMQSLFTEGMTLENNGQCEECWHIDHKIPISSAKTEDDVIRLNHYTNLQPLWSRENMSKGKKIIYENTSN